MTLAENDLCLDLLEILSKLPEINYVLKVAIMMFKKSNYQRTAGTLSLPLIIYSFWMMRNWFF